jgi:hypothetical protein
MSRILLPVLLLLLAAGCRKDNKEFTLKNITLVAYKKPPVAQNLRLRVVGGHNGASLGSSDACPSYLPLPVVLGIQPRVAMELYREGCTVELWGDSTGLIGSCAVDMRAYKIIFPIEMEAHSPALTVALSGSWE